MSKQMCDVYIKNRLGTWIASKSFEHKPCVGETISVTPDNEKKFLDYKVLHVHQYEGTAYRVYLTVKRIYHPIRWLLNLPVWKSY